MTNLPDTDGSYWSSLGEIDMLLWRTFCSFVLSMSFAAIACGDIAPGRGLLPKPPLLVPVKIVEGNFKHLDPNVAAKLIIPSSMLPDLQQSSRLGPSAQGTNESPADGLTIVAGLVLTAAAISLMFVNKKGANWKTGVIGVITCTLLFAAILLLNYNSSPTMTTPATIPSLPQQLIVIEVQQHGHEVTLVLPATPQG